jgi:asparagine synthase (glutamine-hydrolysing)
MCGIAGFSQIIDNQEEQTRLLESFASLQVHRGPDYTGISRTNSYTFIHHRLSLIDAESRSNQPFENEDFVLCFNGEIYNFLKLKQQLPNVSFKTTSDTEVLFHFLINFGIEKTLKELKGMFAFSFYNKKTDTLFLARDRFGIKPLYFHNYANGFSFASEIRTLAKIFTIKPDSFQTIMSLNSTAEGSTSYTLFPGIEMVKPGCFLEIKSNKVVHETSYYKFADDIDKNYYSELSKMPKKEIVATFDSLLQNAVDEMMVSDFKMGSFVSGGIDSSILTALASKNHKNLELFTANIKGKFSEYEDANTLSKHLGLPLYESVFQQNDFIDNWLEATVFNAAPLIYFTNGIPISRVAQVARQHDVKAVICGEGSDELFVGYSKLLAEQYKNTLLLPVNVLRKLYKIYPALSEYLFPSSKNRLDVFSVKLANGFKEDYLTKEGENQYNFISKNKRKYYVDSYEMMQKHLHGLLHRNDRMGMIHSIEVRFPFLHEDVVKFGLNLPLEYKTRTSLSVHNKKHPFKIDKWIVREISKKYLPQSLVAKKKNGLPIDGLTNLKIDKTFFENGYLQQKLQMSKDSLRFMLENENPYFIGKLASVEIFGLYYDLALEEKELQEKISNSIKY